MSQRGVQLTVGRLVTDRVFRGRVEHGGSAYLAALRTSGIDLSRTEIAMLIGIDPAVWRNLARQLEDGSEGVRVTSSDQGPGMIHALTAQQQRVLAGICDGMRNQEIADQLGISESAVKATIQQLFRKFKVHRRVQLLRLTMDARVEDRDGAQTKGTPAQEASR